MHLVRFYQKPLMKRLTSFLMTFPQPWSSGYIKFTTQTFALVMFYSLIRQSINILHTQTHKVQTLDNDICTSLSLKYRQH